MSGVVPGPELIAFRAFVYRFWRIHGRHDLPWRLTRDPYEILVSEVMLQQTQVSRALEKYPAFLRSFPGPHELAAAPLAEVLRAWQGLGYNRRARNLHRLAAVVVTERDGRLPQDFAGLLRLPGVGPATAGAVCAFAYGSAHPFLETNIRAVFLHHFFPGRSDVPEKALIAVAEAALDRHDPRSWHYALMDYGSELKKLMPNPSRRGRVHSRQAPFEGSRRQLRGRMLRLLLEEGDSTESGLAERLGADAERDRVRTVLGHLEAEGLVASSPDGRWRIA